MTCQALTKKGTICTFKAKEHGYCNRHKNYLINLKVKCKGKTKQGNNCKNFACSDGYCKRHYKI